MKKKERWKIYNNSPAPKYFWEDGKSGTGLLLGICARCGEKQTRETYLRGFWKTYYELIEYDIITAIAQHKCGQWHKVTS